MNIRRKIRDIQGMRADFVHIRGFGYRAKNRRIQIEVNFASNMYAGGYLLVNASPHRVFRRGTHG